jgi:hypothetical protein
MMIATPQQAESSRFRFPTTTNEQPIKAFKDILGAARTALKMLRLVLNIAYHGGLFEDWFSEFLAPRPQEPRWSSAPWPKKQAAYILNGDALIGVAQRFLAGDGGEVATAMKPKGTSALRFPHCNQFIGHFPAWNVFNRGALAGRPEVCY